MQKILKKHFINVLKISFAAGLIFWMVDSGKLDFGQLALLSSRPAILLITILGWLFVVIFLGTFRWWLLLQGLGIAAHFRRAVNLHMIGLFFNSTMPGAVGGDIIKAVYIMRDSQTTNKTPAMLTILLDRIVGLIAMFCIGTVAVSLNFSALWAIPALQQLIIFIFMMFVCSIVFFVLVFLPYQEDNDPVMRLFNLHIPGFAVLRKIYAALRCYRDRPRILFYALGISIVIQTTVLIYFVFLTRVLNQSAPNFFNFASIYPVGMLVTALPLAPGGMGVGHVAFEKLYDMIGIKNGANVFNIYFLSMISLNLLGAIPYIFFKKTIPTDLEELENN